MSLFMYFILTDWFYTYRQTRAKWFGVFFVMIYYFRVHFACTTQHTQYNWGQRETRAMGVRSVGIRNRCNGKSNDVVGESSTEWFLVSTYTWQNNTLGPWRNFWTMLLLLKCRSRRLLIAVFVPAIIHLQSTNYVYFWVCRQKILISIINHK